MAKTTTVQGSVEKSCARLAGKPYMNHQAKKAQLVVRASKILISRTARFYEISATSLKNSHFLLESMH
jgi:hypothetical protein